jgi:hypothetical protein
MLTGPPIRRGCRRFRHRLVRTRLGARQCTRVSGEGDQANPRKKTQSEAPRRRPTTAPIELTIGVPESECGEDGREDHCTAVHDPPNESASPRFVRGMLRLVDPGLGAADDQPYRQHHEDGHQPERGEGAGEAHGLGRPEVLNLMIGAIRGGITREDSDTDAEKPSDDQRRPRDIVADPPGTQGGGTAPACRSRRHRLPGKHADHDCQGQDDRRQVKQIGARQPERRSRPCRKSSQSASSASSHATSCLYQPMDTK